MFASLTVSQASPQQQLQEFEQLCGVLYGGTGQGSDRAQADQILQ